MIIFMKKKYILIVLILVAVFLSAFFVYRKVRSSRSVGISSNPPISTASTISSNVNQQVAVVNSLINSATGLNFPIADFAERMKLNFFGTHFSAATPRNQYPDSVCPNNTLYTGYHTAVDLETTSDEQNIAVPVDAVSDGTIVFAGSASGYGGLVIIGFVYNNQNYTAVYGHIDTRTLKVSVGQKVSQGDLLADLAPACSVYSGNNRKHLHFGIHKGTTINESGYVSTQTELNGWVDPRLFFGI